MSPWTEFVKMHINKCPGATPQARMRACAAKYKSRRHGGGARAGSIFTDARKMMNGKDIRSGPAVFEQVMKKGRGDPPKGNFWTRQLEEYRRTHNGQNPPSAHVLGKGVRSIMPARQGVGLHVGAGARKRRPKARSQQALAAAIHGLVSHGRGRR